MNIRRALHVASINLLLIGFGIVVVELIFGSWVNPDSLNKLNIIKNKEYKFNVDDLYNWNNKNVVYKRDKYGLRGKFDRPEDIDILTVGGSTTDQHYIGEGYTWQDVIQREFEKENTKVVVANAGVDGHSSFGHIKSFELWFPYIKGLKPKFFLFYVGTNDFYLEKGRRVDALSKNKKDDLQQKINELKDKSAIYYLLRVLKGVYMARYVYNVSHRKIDFNKVDWTDAGLLDDYDEIMNSMMPSYLGRIDRLVDLTVERGAIPIFVTQPSRRYKLAGNKIYGSGTLRRIFRRNGKIIRINGLDYHRMMSILNRNTMTGCQKRKAICIDLAKDLEFAWEDEDYYDFLHMTPAGAEKVGKYLYKALRNNPEFYRNRRDR